MLRQVVVSGERIDELSLALYDGGRRSDVWRFQALPELTDGKLLPNYWVGGARAGDADTVVLDVFGSMYRPQGGWWTNGKDVTLALRGEALALQRVRSAYGFIHDYDRGEDPDAPAFTVLIEREVEGRFERRDLYPVSVAAIKAAAGRRGRPHRARPGGPGDRRGMRDPRSEERGHVAPARRALVRGARIQAAAGMRWNRGSTGFGAGVSREGGSLYSDRVRS